MSWLSEKLRRGKAPVAHQGTLAGIRNLLRWSPKSLDVCFFIPEASRGWILEAAMREIADRYPGRFSICTDFESLPPNASAYYFVHYHFYLHAMLIYPWLHQKNNVVWFTHPKDENLGGAQAVEHLKLATVVTMCARWRDYLLTFGLAPDRVKTIVGGADPSMFVPHQRGQGKVGFCTAYYERKQPDQILDLVRSLPEQDFILLGRNWEKYPRFSELQSQGNFEYRTADYAEYPAFYAELDVFVSVSQLEGGPIPLLESMMSNLVPVASNTGFAPDLIQHGTNGFLFSADRPCTHEIVDLIRQARRLQGDIRASVLAYNWDNYAAAHHKLFQAA